MNKKDKINKLFLEKIEDYGFDLDKEESRKIIDGQREHLTGTLGTLWIETKDGLITQLSYEPYAEREYIDIEDIEEELKELENE